MSPKATCVERLSTFQTGIEILKVVSELLVLAELHHVVEVLHVLDDRIQLKTTFMMRSLALLLAPIRNRNGQNVHVKALTRHRHDSSQLTSKNGPGMLAGSASTSAEALWFQRCYGQCHTRRSENGGRRTCPRYWTWNQSIFYQICRRIRTSWSMVPLRKTEILSEFFESHFITSSCSRAIIFLLRG